MAEPENSELVERVCSTCLGDNLLHRIGIKGCARCREPFCIHNASIYDNNTYCSYCFSDLSVTRSIITKTNEVYLSDEDKCQRVTRKAVRTVLGGADWFFASRRHADMTDDELAVSIWYHQIDLQLLFDEAAKRKAERSHKQAAKPTPINKGSSTKVESTTVKPAARTSASKKMDEAQKLIAQLGLSPEQLAKMLGI